MNKVLFNVVRTGLNPGAVSEAESFYEHKDRFAFTAGKYVY